MPETPAHRRPRRAVGPPGAIPGAEPVLDLDDGEPGPARPDPDAEERYRREQPPHHDRGV